MPQTELLEEIRRTRREDLAKVAPKVAELAPPDVADLFNQLNIHEAAALASALPTPTPSRSSISRLFAGEARSWTTSIRNASLPFSKVLRRTNGRRSSARWATTRAGVSFPS